MIEITKNMKQNLIQNNEKNFPRHLEKIKLPAGNHIDFDMTQYQCWTKESLYHFKKRIKDILFDKYPNSYECLKSLAEVEKFI